MKTLSITTVILLFLLTITSCNTETYKSRAEFSAYEFAMAQKSVAALNNFLAEYPNGKYYDKINTHIQKVMSPDYNQTSGLFFDPRDSLIYAWIRIGSQIWMAEDLNYNNGQSRLFYKISDWDSIAPPGWKMPEKQDFELLVKQAEEISRIGWDMVHSENFSHSSREEPSGLILMDQDSSIREGRFVFYKTGSGSFELLALPFQENDQTDSPFDIGLNSFTVRCVKMDVRD
jgi:uncharacterized protein (TIGR02145 family)